MIRQQSRDQSTRFEPCPDLRVLAESARNTIRLATKQCPGRGAAFLTRRNLLLRESGENGVPILDIGATHPKPLPGGDRPQCTIEWTTEVEILGSSPLSYTAIGFVVFRKFRERI